MTSNEMCNDHTIYLAATLATHDKMQDQQPTTVSGLVELYSEKNEKKEKSSSNFLKLLQKFSSKNHTSQLLSAIH